MNVRNELRIRVAADGSVAVIEHLPVGTTRHDILFVLDQNGVTEGIKDLAISDALLALSAAGVPQTDIVVAEATANRTRYELGGRFFFPVDLGEKMGALAVYAACLEGPDGTMVKERGTFVSRGDIALRIFHETAGTDIFGKPLPVHPPETIPGADPGSVAIDKKNETTEYRALHHGYLRSDADGRIGVMRPVRISGDRSRLDFIIAPLEQGDDACIEYLNNRCQQIPHATRMSTAYVLCWQAMRFALSQ